MAAHESEAGVDEALRQLIEHGQAITPEAVAARVRAGLTPTPVTAVTVAAVDLSAYDALLSEEAA